MRRLTLAAVVAALAVPASAQSQGPDVWTIDPNHSSAGFSVRHMMVSTVRGTLGLVKGTIAYDGRSVESIKADVTIDVGGVNTGNESRDRDLRSADGLFDVSKYPTATFKSTRAIPGASAGTFKLVGDLTLHGVTKEVTLDVDGPSPPLRQGPTLRAGASATTTINRKDFGLSYNRMVETAPVVSDEVKITIDLEATKKG